MHLKNKEALFIILLAASSFIIYSNTFNANFILDDNHLISENAFIASPKYFVWFFKGFVTSYAISMGMCRPLLMLSFAFNYWNGGLNPIGYHIVNILFHFLNASLLYFLLKLLKKDAPRGLLFIITLLFVLHPINTEAVTYISSRSDLMVTFFLLSGFLLYLKRRYVATLLMYVLALLSKETGLCLPLLVFGYDFVYRNENKGFFKNWLNKRAIIIYAVFFILTYLYFIYKATFFSSPTPALPIRSYYANTLLQSATALMYLKLFIFPHPLTIVHYIPSLDSLLFYSFCLISTTILISLIIFIFIFRRKYPLITFGASWFFIGLLPKFYARLRFFAMEHHFYIASIGIYIILVVLLNKLYTKQKKYFLYISTGILLIFATLNWFRNYEYKDTLSFWKITAERNPHSGPVCTNLGLEYLKRGLNDLAEKEFKKAISLPDKESVIRAKINLSIAYIRQKKYKEALKEIQDTLDMKKIPPLGANVQLGYIYMEMGKQEQGLRAWEEELKLYPASAEAYLNLGKFYLGEGNVKKAKALFARAVEVNPNHYGGYYGLARVSEKENKPKEAAYFYQKTLLVEPNIPEVHYFLGAIYVKLGDSRAIDEFRWAVKLNPNFAQAHNDLALVYAFLNQPNWELAKKHAQIAESLGYRVEEEVLRLIERNTKP